jgi:hypothetical protein
MSDIDARMRSDLVKAALCHPWAFRGLHMRRVYLVPVRRRRGKMTAAPRRCNEGVPGLSISEGLALSDGDIVDQPHAIKPGCRQHPPGARGVVRRHQRFGIAQLDVFHAVEPRRPHFFRSLANGHPV